MPSARIKPPSFNKSESEMLLHNNYKNRLGLLFQIANQQINSYSLQANSRPLHGGTGLYLTNIQVYSIDYRLFDVCYLTGNEAIKYNFISNIQPTQRRRRTVSLSRTAAQASRVPDTRERRHSVGKNLA